MKVKYMTHQEWSGGTLVGSDLGMHLHVLGYRLPDSQINHYFLYDSGYVSSDQVVNRRAMLLGGKVLRPTHDQARVFLLSLSGIDVVAMPIVPWYRQIIESWAYSHVEMKKNSIITIKQGHGTKADATEAGLLSLAKKLLPPSSRSSLA